MVHSGPFNRKSRRVTVALALCVWGGIVALALPAVAREIHQAFATPPAQPTTGPGGSEYRFGGMTEKAFGTGDSAYTVFLPNKPIPEEAPIVVFTHGWSAVEPGVYGAWISHIVRRNGAIVIFPRYQADNRTPTRTFLSNAVSAVRDAMTRLRTGELGIRPLEKQGAYVGHSVGGLLAANLAAVAQ